MLTALLLAAAQPSQPAPPPAAEPPIDVTATIIAYVKWRTCLDVYLGPPPRARPPRKDEREKAFAACRAFEDTLRTESVAAFGEKDGAEMFARSMSTTRSELGDTEAQP